MRPWTDFLEVTATLLAVVEPLGLIPLFLAGTRGFTTRKRLQAALTACLTMVAVLVVAVLVGERLFRMFSIGIASFRVGGGIVLLLTAIHLVMDPSPEPTSQPPQGESNFAVVPLGVPLLAGPGAITAVLIQSQKYDSALDTVLLIGCVVLVALASFLCLALGQSLARLLGTRGVDVIGRLLGLVLAALSIEFIASGLAGLFPVLGRALQ